MQLEGSVFFDSFEASSPFFGSIAFREQADSPAGGADVLVDEEDDAEEKDEKSLRCVVCQASITSPKERVSKNGKHLHTFFNPAGIVYEIGCFRKAPGGLVYGPASTEFAWFSGYAWQIVYCHNCSEHLGWFFSGAGDSFFGLIVNRLQ